MYITLLSFHIVTLFFFLTWICRYIYIYICIGVCMRVYIYIYCYCCALEQQDRSSMLLLLLLWQRLFSYACIYVIKRAGLVMVFGKKKRRKTSFFFFFFFFLALLRSYLIDAIFDDDVLSLFSFSCRWDSICSLKVHSTNGDSTKRENETR